MTGPTDQDGGSELDQPNAATQLRSPAVVGRPVWPLFIGIAATVLVVDQLTKAWVVRSIAQGSSIRVLGDLVRFIHSRNNGALFGLFGSSAPILAVASIAVLGAIVWYHARSGRNLIVSVALGLLLGGALGNLFDRIHYGYVVDWVDLGLGAVRWWTFNVGDAAISVAIVLLLLIAIRPGPGSPSTDG